ncbi:hypothetical protein CCHR01_01204 [Colletotrichum chrysophilum]|uniref:Clr5 domain-containing protein n=1 Tax=Colletotrichum chrysophilum TaxID=1836956 RepID=A0AAD9ELF5_9PEZI|nr:hypothetical protein CCHR01_01204 [Colletotrichum chrysophilum]
MVNNEHTTSDGSSGLVELVDGDETIALTTEDPVQLGAPSAPKRRALPVDWEQHKERIRQLYLDENKPLKDVMTIMNQNHGHSGSIKQYKNRLREWGFDTKYARHQDSRKRKHKAGALLASPTDDHQSRAPSARTAGDNALQAPDNEPRDVNLFQFPEVGSIDGRLLQALGAGCAVDEVFKSPDVDWTAFQPFQPVEAIYAGNQLFQALDAEYGYNFTCQAVDAEDADDPVPTAGGAARAGTSNITRQDSVENEDDLRLSSPRRNSTALSRIGGLPFGRSVTPPISPISIAERIFSLSQEHIRTSFVFKVWNVDASNACMSVLCTKDDKDLPESSFDLVRSAVLLFQQGSAAEGRHVVSKAFALVKPILRSGNVRALNFFWTSLIFLVQLKYGDIAVALVRHIYEMAQILLGPSHPFSHMFKLLTRVEMSEFEFIVERAWQTTADAFRKQLPGFHPEYVRQQCDLIYRTNGFKDPANAEQRLRQLLKNCEDTAQTTKMSRLTILNALGYNFMNSNDWVQAVNVGQELEEYAQFETELDLIVYRIGGIEIQARAFNKLKLIMPAVKCLKQATQLIKEHWGEQDAWRIELMLLQENFLRENGDIRAADDLKAERHGITEIIDTDEDSQVFFMS